MALDKKSSSTRGSGRKTVVMLLIVGLLAGLGGLVYAYLQMRNDKQELQAQLTSTRNELETYRTNPEEAARAEVRRYVDEVGKLYALPEGEEPSVATVSDKSKLQDQQFFSKAENGDVTLIYPNAKLAVLYRPTTKQIVNVSSVTLQDQQKPDPTN
jgi:type II secretory pathway pseudopilin PulG